MRMSGQLHRLGEVGFRLDEVAVHLERLPTGIVGFGEVRIDANRLGRVCQ